MRKKPPQIIDAEFEVITPSRNAVDFRPDGYLTEDRVQPEAPKTPLWERLLGYALAAVALYFLARGVNAVFGS